MAIDRKDSARGDSPFLVKTKDPVIGRDESARPVIRITSVEGEEKGMVSTALHRRRRRCPGENGQRRPVRLYGRHGHADG
ncbi:MAG: hypothetical protein MZV70_59180 [Desulfobacterales bacterium]|nr:hypothetical protein [Desulfobacterales bacterium]